MDLCKIHSTWQVSGLRGSGSHEVSLQDVFVPEHMMTKVTAGLRYKESPLYHLPPFSRLAYNKVGVATGTARAALNEFVELASTKIPRASGVPLRERVHVQLAVANAEVTLRSARAWVVEGLNQLWDLTAAGRQASSKERALLHLACTHACTAAVDAVGIVHELAGTTANFNGQALERRFRDVQVVRQHILLSRQWNENIGRVLLGLPAGVPFF
jgi:alkylation response protein AidB-like acyl-CoA dehydrogenase